MAAGTPIVSSDIHGYKGVVRRGREACSSRRASRASSPPRSTRLLRDPRRARMGAAGQARAEEFSWPSVTAKVDDYYGFVIRRLAASGSLGRLPGRDPAALRRPRHAAPGHRRPRRATATESRPAAAGGPRGRRDSASASRQTDAE